MALRNWLRCPNCEEKLIDFYDLPDDELLLDCPNCESRSIVDVRN